MQHTDFPWLQGMSEQVSSERAEQAAAAASLLDTKDETVRGTIPLFNLKRRDQRQDYLKRVTSNRLPNSDF